MVSGSYESATKYHIRAMRKEINLEKKFCGNCKWHNVYNYPNFIFCFERYMDHKDPVMSTLDCCEEWEPHNDECFCVKEAMSDRKHRIEKMGDFNGQEK